MIRLELLQQFGGVYLDLDVLLLRPLGELLRTGWQLTLAHEGIAGTIGAGNALMLAQVPSVRPRRASACLCVTSA